MVRVVGIKKQFLSTVRCLLTRAISTEPDISDSWVLVLDKSITAEKPVLSDVDRNPPLVATAPTAYVVYAYIYTNTCLAPKQKIIIINNTENIAIITKSKDKKTGASRRWWCCIYVVRGGRRGPSPRVMQSTDRCGQNCIMRSSTIIPKTSKTLGFAHINYDIYSQKRV